MPRIKKKAAGGSKSLPNGKPETDSVGSNGWHPDSFAPFIKQQNKAGPRKRGWRDIEAISERARLKNMLVDIWHEDIELDDDIFGDSDQMSGYYAKFEEETAAEEEIDIDNDLIDDDEDFEEKEG